MMNLLDETIHALQTACKTPKDVRWVGTRAAAWTWDDFASLASGIEYDNGYGGQEIHSDLVVVGDDWWLERGEYDGSEGWEFKTLPKRQGAVGLSTLVLKRG